MEDRCVCCGAIIPEGRQVCPSCEKDDKLNQCDCLIGEWLDYEDTKLVTEQELLFNIEETNKIFTFKRAKVTVADYCDFRKSVNMIRFRYCPECGRKIDWKGIRRRANNE